MEDGFLRDFSSVRVHTDTAAAQSAADIQAHAYTAGHHIVFGANQFAPQSPHGRNLIAHELTHVLQQGGSGLIMRRSSFGAGGCASATEEDETDAGPKGAGRLAHNQIQTFLLPILNEVRIPRATKQNISKTGCQDPGTEEGRADLLKRSGVLNTIGEIKPVRHDPSVAVGEAEHYVRRSEQSMDRLFGSATCGPSGDDDRDFAKTLSISKLRPSFGLLDGILPADTVIGAFDGDSSRTLKAKLMAPGAVGYWCTGGKSDTYTCGVSEAETRAFIDKVALGPAQQLLDTFIREQVQDRLEKALSKNSLGDLIKIAEKHLGTQIRQMLRPYLGPLADQILNQASAEAIADLIDKAIGPEARAIATTLIRRIIDAMVNELRVQLRNALTDIIKEALLALCVGVPAVTIVELLDKLRELLKSKARMLIPVVVTVVASQLVATLLNDVAAMLQSLVSALGKALSAIGSVLAVIGEIVLRALAVVAILLLIVGALILGVLALIALFDPVPGDEVALGAAALVLVGLIPVLGRFVATGSTEGKGKGA